MFKMIGKLLFNMFIKWLDKNEPYTEKYYNNALGSMAVSSNYVTATKSSGPGPRSHISDGNFGLNFIVFNAQGGKVIQMSSYNQHTDKSSTNLYIVTDSEDLGQELNLIITRESLTR